MQPETMNSVGSAQGNVDISGVALSKSLMDFFGSLTLLILLSPFMLCIALAVKLGSRGPIFYSEIRQGLNGVGFPMMKFRTMVPNASAMQKDVENEVDGPMFKCTDDPRITGVGGFLRGWSLDELPQLINVLRGEMSLVGPRPLPDEQMEGHPTWKQTRLSVKPGLTGLWQIQARDSDKFSDWVKYDTEYVRHWSIALDIKILFLTIGAVIGRRGAR
ncbi:MAG: sugar transferase [Magnetococcales bacterium]|nr:sugar transferase [Magnetococcales bacterium]